MKLTNEAALELLQAMVTDSCSEFDQGAKLYVEGLREANKAKKKISEDMRSYVHGREKMARGAEIARLEAKFLNGEEPIHPIVDGEYVMIQLLQRICAKMDNITVSELLQMVRDVIAPQLTEKS